VVDVKRKKPASGEFSIILAWLKFEENHTSDSMPRHLQLLVETAYFMGAKAALELSAEGEVEAEADINERLIGLSTQIDDERKQFLKSPEGRGL
jgi:hypothetical protein